jgi:uroporphyrinogen decarboxylase
MTISDLPPLLRVLAGETLERPPIWFMRQAGRSLPEYLALRAKAKDFIALCHEPEMAAEVTLQPLRRFPFNAAIVFADILLLPAALGQEVWFEPGEGPRLGPIPSLESLRAAVPASAAALAFVYETLRRVRAELPTAKALIGFAGGPWTVATYMIEGRGGNRVRSRSLVFEDLSYVAALVYLLVEATALYLAEQSRAGAQALQIFESWAELLPEDVFQTLVTAPHAAIVRRLREMGVDTPIIGFPRGAGALVEDYAAASGVQAVGLDVQAPAALGRKIQARMAIQGALDPLLLRAGGAALDARVEVLLRQWGGGPYIFNLGHGVLPDTPLSHIERVVKAVTGK